VRRDAFRFDAGAHVYRLGAHVVPAISAILRGAGYSRDAPWLLDEHKERGHAVHLACLAYDLGDEPAVAPEWKGYVDAWIAFSRAMRPMWRQLEQPRVSRTLWFAGTPDRVGLVSGRPSVLEIKAGAECDWHQIQTAAQDILTREAGRPRQRRLVVYLTPEGRYRLREHDDPRDELHFLWALRQQHLQDPPPR
jgi:hypothetical protein